MTFYNDIKMLQIIGLEVRLVPPTFYLLSTSPIISIDLLFVSCYKLDVDKFPQFVYCSIFFSAPISKGSANSGMAARRSSTALKQY